MPFLRHLRMILVERRTGPPEMELERTSRNRTVRLVFHYVNCYGILEINEEAQGFLLPRPYFKPHQKEPN